MKNIKEFDQKTLKVLRTELDAVLAKFEKKSGVEIKLGKIKYSSNTISLAIEGKIVGSQSIEAQKLELFTKFKENDIIRLANLGECKVVGFKSKNRKYPYIVETLHTAKRYKLSESQIEARVNIV